MGPGENYLIHRNDDFQQVTHKDLTDVLCLLDLLAALVITDHLAFRKHVSFCLRDTTISYLSDYPFSVSSVDSSPFPQTINVESS